MAKKRSDYEQSFPGRFSRWIKNGSDPLDKSLERYWDENEEERQKEAVIHREEEKLAREEINAAPEQYDLMHKLAAIRSGKVARRVYCVLSVLVCIGIIGTLIYTASYLPEFGGASDPVNNEVSERYIEKGMEETGAVNIVAGMILDYRAFDTLGESNVLFVAACAVIILLRICQGDGRLSLQETDELTNDRHYEPKNDLILQHIAKVLVPISLLFGMYIVLNGHISPGGGFSGGAVMGAGLILYLSAYGFKKTERFFTFTTFRVISVCALGFYACSKAYSFFTGANELYSIITPGTPGNIFSAGLIPYLNLAVGLVVCCTMYAFYTLFRKGDM